MFGTIRAFWLQGHGMILRPGPDQRTNLDMPGDGLFQVLAKGRTITKNFDTDVLDCMTTPDRRVCIKTPEGRMRVPMAFL